MGTMSVPTQRRDLIVEEVFKRHAPHVKVQPGDTKLIWDPGNATEVEAARSTFDSLRAKGFMAYRVTGLGNKGEVLQRFDPSVEKMILAPAPRGG